MFHCATATRKTQQVETREKLQKLLEDASILSLLASEEGPDLLTSPTRDVDSELPPVASAIGEKSARKRISTMTTFTSDVDAADKASKKQKEQNFNGKGRGRGRGGRGEGRGRGGKPEDKSNNKKSADFNL